MKIQQNEAIKQFFMRCKKNLMNEQKNQFLGMTVTQENQLEVQRKMKHAGFQEFQGSEETWPSLFISSETYKKSPYNSQIRLDQIKEQEFRFSKEVMPANELFNVSSIHPDVNRELNDWMTLRALDQNYDAAVLWQDDDVWMLDSPSEANTIDPYANKAHGAVLTFGLGIGYFIFMAMRNPNVKSITVIEQSEAVISMFETFILPQFPKDIPLTIIKGDAFDYFNESFLRQYDYIFVDIWKSSDDGFMLIESLLEQYLPPFDKIDFWIESSCFEVMPALIFLYFEAIANHKQIQHEDPYYHQLLMKIHRYFSAIDKTVSDVSELKHYMYDTKTLRLIVANQ